MVTKTCSFCGVTGQIEGFVKGTSTCKVCRAAYRRKMYAKHHVKQLADKKKYYAENREKILAYQRKRRENILDYRRKWREEYREEIAKRRRKYREENREKIAEYMRKYRQENREKINASDRKYREDNRVRLFEVRRRYRAKNRARISARARIWWIKVVKNPAYRKKRAEHEREQTAKLVDRYVALVLGIPLADCPPMLIEAKRAHLKLHRLIKEKMK